MKILVVDDTEANRKLLAWILEDEGHDVIEANNGKVAVEMFKEARPDLVLMDVMMPVMDGYESTQAIKEYLGDTHVPIIFLTALSDDASLTKCLTIGGDDFLSKPINEKVLQAKIKAHSRIKDLNTQISQNNEELTRLHQLTTREHEIAENVFKSALADSRLDSSNVRHHISPATIFNGDLLLITIGPAGSLYALMADFTGHGLPAAIGALPISQAFFEAAHDGASVSTIALQLNRTLEKFLPDDMFAAAAIAELNADGTRLSLWMGGVPDAYLTDANNRLTRTLTSTHMPLGILSDQDFERDLYIIDVNPNDKLFLYTDGIPEALDSNGLMYGEKRLLSHFQGQHADPLDSVIHDVADFCGSEEQMDDITMLELYCRPVQGEQNRSIQSIDFSRTLPWKMTFKLTEKELKHTSAPMAQVVDMIASAPGVEHHKDYLHTILTELFSNSLEHGILGLKSELKESEEGYLDYYQQRENRLDTLENGTIYVSIRFQGGIQQGNLSIRVDDSGCGFNLETKHNANDNDSFGRGISLLESLCDKITYSEGGTRVDVQYIMGPDLPH